MGTRGIFGFYYKGRYYVAYNHFDSYPEGLGNNIVNQIRNAKRIGTFDHWIDLLVQLRVIQEHITPTPDDIKALEPYTNLNVSNQSTDDWYCLVHKCQGNLYKVLESGYLLPHMDAEGTPYFEQYAYVVNFDTNDLDFYIGSEKLESYSLDNLPDVPGQ